MFKQIARPHYRDNHKCLQCTAAYLIECKMQQVTHVAVWSHQRWDLSHDGTLTTVCASASHFRAGKGRMLALVCLLNYSGRVSNSGRKFAEQFDAFNACNFGFNVSTCGSLDWSVSGTET